MPTAREFASQPRTWAGVPLALAAAVAFALANTSATLAYQNGSNPITIAAARFVLPIVVLSFWLYLGGSPLRLPSSQGRIAAVLGVITAIYNLALLSAINIIPLALAVLVFYLFPLIAIVILSSFRLEKLRTPTILMMALALGGLTLALNPRAGSLDYLGVALAFVAALGLGTVIVVSGQIVRAADSRPVTLYMATIASISLVTFCFLKGEFVLPQNGLGWVGFAGAAVFYTFAMVSFYIAISKIGPTNVALLSYTEPVAAAGLSVILLGQVLDLYQVVGIALVITALIGAVLSRSMTT